MCLLSILSIQSFINMPFWVYPIAVALVYISGNNLHRPEAAYAMVRYHMPTLTPTRGNDHNHAAGLLLPIESILLHRVL